MASSYKDRLEGGYRYVRIRKVRTWTIAGLILATSGLVAVSLWEARATAKPLYMPVEAFLPTLLAMLFIGIVLEMFFRDLAIKYSKKDSQRYLMVTNSIGRAKGTILICVVIAFILLAPLTRTGVEGSAIPAGGAYTITTNPWIYRFDSQDGAGVTRFTAIIVTLLSGSSLKIEIARDSTFVAGPPPIAQVGRSVSIPLDTDQVHTYSITFTATTGGPLMFSEQLQGQVLPALFSVVPGFAAALAGVSFGFILYLRPRKDQYKQAAIYSGEFRVTVDPGERLFSEYQALRPVGNPTTAGGNSPPIAPNPGPVVSAYVAPPTPVAPPPPSPMAVRDAPRREVSPTRMEPARPAVMAPPPRSPADLFAEGATLFSHGEYELAIDKFDEVLRLESRNPRARLGKAEALLRLGDTKEALESYDAILRHDRGNLDALLGTAAVYSAERRWRDVIDLADTFLAMQPGEPDMLVYRGDAQFALGKRSEAQISYEAALQQRPGDPRILARIEKSKMDIAGLQSRALIASASGNLDQAVALFDEILKVEPENANSLVGKSVALRRAGRVGEALACLDAVLARQPGHGGALLNKGRMLEERGDLEDALEAYDKLIELNPMDPDAWVAQGDVLAKMGRDEVAMKSYGEALKISPTDEDTKGKMTSLESGRAEEGQVLRELFQIKGIGPAKARALRDAGFRTIADFKRATEDSLAQVRGITRKVAADVVKHFGSR